MSTYISPSFQQSQYVSGIPLDLIVQVGAQKQMQYNTVKDNLQSQLNMIGSADIIKESDREFINSKLQETVNKMNEYSGSDLTNSGIQSELTGLVSSLTSDNDLYGRISNNRKAAGELRRIQQLKQDGDETYNSSNEKVFMDQLNAWQNNPDQVQFNGTYTPYSNVQKQSMELIEPILKNPDIRREITHYIDENGVAQRRTDTEIKEITQERIMQALRGLPESAVRQLQIDYEAGKGSMSVEGALNGLQNRLLNKSNTLTSLQEKLANPNVLENTKIQIQNLINQTTADINNIQQTANAVVANNDPTLYYDTQSYIQDRLYDMAQSYAYSQVGDTKLDPLFSKEVDFNYDKQLKAIDHAYTMEQIQYKTRAEAEAAQAKLAAGPGIVNDFKDQLINIRYNGKGTLTQEQTLPLLNGVGKINDDGSAQLQLSGRKLYIDIVPTLKGAGIDVNNEIQANAYQDAQEAYKKWLNKTGARSPEEAGGIFGKLELINPNPLMRSTRRKPVKSFDEFLSTVEGKNLNQQVKQYGVDLTNQTDVNNIKKYINSPETQALSQLFGKGLENMVGTGNFTPFRQDNILSDKNGDMYTKGTLRMTQKDWITKFNGITDNDGEDLFEKLYEDGYIKYSQGTEGEDDAIAELTVTTKLDRDLNSAMEENLRKRFSGDKATTEQIPLYMADWQNDWTTTGNILRSTSTTDIPSLVGRANENIYTLTKDMTGERKKSYNQLIGSLESVLKDPNSTSKNKFLAMGAINELGTMTLEQLEQKQREASSQVGSVPVPTGVRLPNDKQLEAFLNIPHNYKLKIADVSEKYGVPSGLLQGLIFQESAYNPKARSPKGAVGLGQFMPETASQYGVNRTDPDSSIEGAAKYLSELYAQFKDWNLALAAYNAGPNRASLREGRIPDIPETQEYVARINAYANQFVN